MPGSLLPARVLPLLRGRFGREYLYVASCASTQRLLGPDAPEGAIAVTDHQREGRGRLGRRWEDAPGAALLVSAVLRPDVPPSRLPELTLLGAAACAEAVERLTGITPEVKEPNDLLVGGLKVAGVLGEAAERRVVLGFGVNVGQTAEQLPAEARLPATSLRLLGRSADRGRLLAELLAALERRYDAWLSEAAGRAR